MKPIEQEKKKKNSPGGGTSVFKKPKSMKQHCKGFVMLGHKACEGQVTGGMTRLGIDHEGLDLFIASLQASGFQ